MNSIKHMESDYGNIYINFSTPFSLQEYIKDINLNKINNETIISTLANEIIHRYNNFIQCI